VIGHNTDQALVMALDILSEVLVTRNPPRSGLHSRKQAIGQDVSAVSNNYKQNVFQIIVQNANQADKDKFNAIVRKCMQDAIDKGLDKQVVEGIINPYGIPAP